MARQIFTGEACSCRRGIERDNCPACEGTGRRIDFKAIRAANAKRCGHSACSQNYIDTGDVSCIANEEN